MINFHFGIEVSKHRGTWIGVCQCNLVLAITAILIGAGACKTAMYVRESGKKIKQFPIEGISRVSIDRLGDFYLISTKGVIRKYDTDGNFKAEYVTPENSAITLFEPWNPLRVFVYNRDKQQVVLLDRFLAGLSVIDLHPSLAVEPFLASPMPNNNFWLFDKADNSIKKIESSGASVMEELNLKLEPGDQPDFTFLREYQNQLFLIDRKAGIRIFSVLAQPIRTLPVKDLNFLGFLGEEVYFLDKGKIKLYDLYTEDQREIQVDPQALFVMLTDERMIIVKASVVEVWEYKP